MSSDDYSASEGLMDLIRSINNGPAEGTGIMKLVVFAKNLLGEELPPAIISYNIGRQNNLFGSYPTSMDKVPSIIFAALFAFFMICHLVIFIINTSRGHYFYLSFAWIFFCAMKVIGFALRAKWAEDITLVQLGLASEVFLIVSTFVVVSANLILAQRLFTWRHPVGGSRKLFWSFMFALYGLVLVVIAVTILASFVPYLYYLSWKSYRSWVKTVQFTAILILAYCLTSVSLIGLSFWLPTAKDENRYTYQPWWIESFAPFYFVKKGAAQEAEETFMKRNSNHRHATRVIAATHHHFKMVKGLSTQRGDLKHNKSMAILIITTFLIFFSSIVRTVVVFQAREHRFASAAESPWFAYVCWGIFESIISILYIVGRVDLRFYRPDILPQKVRNIITAQQSYYPSEDEDDDDDMPKAFVHVNNPSHPGQHVYAQHAAGYSPEHQDDRVLSNDSIDSKEWDFADPRKVSTTSSDSVRAVTPPEKAMSPVQGSRYIRHTDDNDFPF